MELPPWTEPQPNNLLLDFCNDEALTALFDNLDANPPVELRIYQDEMDEVIVTESDRKLKLLRIHPYHFFTRLRSKLTEWGSE